MTPDRWASLMQALRTEPHEATYERLVAAYSEPHRYYHTVAHLEACLAEFDTARALAAFPAEVELALWFHDAVYAPTAGDNEARSAAWASEFLAEAGVALEARERVHDHIMATRHAAEADSGDTALVVDVDLSILGQDEATYDAFEANVRKEYRWVPWFVYRRKRGEILQSFLARDAIYASVHFRDRYETRARANLRRAIAALAR